MVRHLADLRVLVVEDEADNAEMLAATLMHEGANARTVANAFDALELAESWRPDVLLLDLWMPEMDGYALARELRGAPATASACIVAVSAHTTILDKTLAAAAGCDAHVSKPVDGDALVALIAKLAAKADRSEERGVRESAVVKRANVPSRSVG